MVRCRHVIFMSATLLAVSACSTPAEQAGDDIIAEANSAINVATSTSSSPSTTLPPITVAPTTTTQEFVANEPFQVEIDLRSTGSEPRFEIRLQPEIGMSQPGLLVQSQLVTASINDVPDPVLASGTEIELRYIVEPGGPNNPDGFALRTDYVRTLVDPDLTDPNVVESLTRQLASLQGLAYRTELTSTGDVLSIDPLTEIIDPVVAQLFAAGLDNALISRIPAPEQAVGLGARWDTSVDTELSGLSAMVRSNVEVVAISDTQAELEFTTTVTYLPGDVDLGGTAAEILPGSVTTGSGTLIWVYDQPIVASDLVLDSATTFDVDGLILEQLVGQTQMLSIG